MEVCEKLARRGDREAAAILLSGLWYMEGPEDYAETALDEQTALVKVEKAAIDAAVALGGACYPVAENFLRLADDPRRRSRAVRVLRGLEDPRAARPLLDALTFDVEEERGLGVAAALEDLGNPQAIDGLVDATLDVRRPLARRREAAEALAAFEDPRCAAALGQVAKEEGFTLVAAYGLFRLTGDEGSRARLEQTLKAGDDAIEAVRLLAKCESSDALHGLLMTGFLDGVPAVRPAVLALLKARFWEKSEARVREALLRSAEGAAVPEFVIAELGEIGGPEAAERLLALVQGPGDAAFWAKAARALARTGEPRAVQYFNRARILEKDPGKRRLAEQLHAEADAERARREKAARG
jgi:HEAT repeat protein